MDQLSPTLYCRSDLLGMQKRNLTTTTQRGGVLNTWSCSTCIIIYEHGAFSLLVEEDGNAPNLLESERRALCPYHIIIIIFFSVVGTLHPHASSHCYCHCYLPEGSTKGKKRTIEWLSKPQVATTIPTTLWLRITNESRTRWILPEVDHTSHFMNFSWMCTSFPYVDVNTYCTTTRPSMRWPGL